MNYQAAPMAPAVNPALTMAQQMATLREAVDPGQREWAAHGLAAYDGWTNPQAVQALVAGARGDAAAPVRAACLRSLARMNVRTLPVLSAVQALKADADPRVRAEAEQALRQLGGADPGMVTLPTPTSSYGVR
jgi:hypothetical protein